MYDWIDRNMYDNVLTIRDYNYYKSKKQRIAYIFENTFAQYLDIDEIDNISLTYASYAILDIYLYNKELDNEELFLVVCVAYWISAKFLLGEDIDICLFSDLVNIPVKLFIDMETKILHALDFKLYSIIEHEVYKHLKIDKRI